MNCKENHTNFEEYLAWIDAILNLCNNIDVVCTNLDKNFPSGTNSSHLVNYKRSINVYEIIKYYSRPNNKPNEVLRHYRTDNEWKNEYITNISGKPKIDEIVQIKQGYKSCLRSFGLNKEVRVKRETGPQEDKIKIEQGLKIVLHSKTGNKRNLERMYDLESEILKNLEIGQKIYITSKTSTKKQVELTKITQDYDYLLEGKIADSKNKIKIFKELYCDVPGVYWDKRSWIASWYWEGKRYYRSFSAKLYGFNRAKYFAIQARLSNLSCSRKYSGRKHSKYILQLLNYFQLDSIIKLAFILGLIPKFVKNYKMCSDPGPSSKWLDLRVPLSVLRPELLLTTGKINQNYVKNMSSIRITMTQNRKFYQDSLLRGSVWEINTGLEFWGLVCTKLSSLPIQLSIGINYTFQVLSIYIPHFKLKIRTLFGTCSREKLWDYFDLDNEYSVDFKKAPKSVKQILKRRSGVRILQQEPFECLISFICSSNNNITRITRMLNEIKRNFGTFLAKSEVNNEIFDFYSFPSVDQLGRATPEQLKKLGLGYRSEFIFRTVEILNSRGLNWLYSLKNEDSDTCKSALTSLPYPLSLVKYYYIISHIQPHNQLTPVDIL